jgi:hypothetical protein
VSTLSRRCLIGAFGASAVIVPTLAVGRAIAQSRPRLLFVHGIHQGGRSEDELRVEWLAALGAGARASGHEVPPDLDVVFPFYGDRLDGFAAEYQVPLASEITTKGDAFQDEFLAFQEEVANELRRGAGITDDQLDEVYGDNPREKGPQNWEWVQAILKAIDRYSPGTTRQFLERFLRDVFVYLQSPTVQTTIDGIVTERLDDRPTVIVAHSLGTVVTYNILRAGAQADVPLLVTLGSPLGIYAIRRRFQPLQYPVQVDHWINAFDDRDVVALHPLDRANFPVTPDVENISDINNQTPNRHGILGYLDKANIAGRILAQV